MTTEEFCGTEDIVLPVWMKKTTIISNITMEVTSMADRGLNLPAQWGQDKRVMAKTEDKQ